MMIYHGSTDIVESPRVILSEKGRDFGPGFYTSDIQQQAEKWAKRQSRYRDKTDAILNTYEFDENAFGSLNIKVFDGYTIEWLNLIVACRQNSLSRHEYDIVIGKITDDDVGETVQSVVDGLAPKDFALKKLTFMSSNNQICFCTETALKYITFISTERL